MAAFRSMIGGRPSAVVVQKSIPAAALLSDQSLMTAAPGSRFSIMLGAPQPTSAAYPSSSSAAAALSDEYVVSTNTLDPLLNDLDFFDGPELDLPYDLAPVR